MERRTFLRLSAVIATGSTASLAGCPDPGQSVLDDNPEEGPRQTATRTTAGPTTSLGGIREEPEYGDWFTNVSNYEGTAVVQRGTEETEILVGAEGNGGNRAFDPAAVAVPIGTTVIWRWTGMGGEHNVVAVDGAFDSGEPVAEPGNRFAVRFPGAGTWRYYSEPSRSAGMKGAVVVYE